MMNINYPLAQQKVLSSSSRLFDRDFFSCFTPACILLNFPGCPLETLCAILFFFFVFVSPLLIIKVTLF